MTTESYNRYVTDQKELDDMYKIIKKKDDIWLK